MLFSGKNKNNMKTRKERFYVNTIKRSIKGNDSRRKSKNSRGSSFISKNMFKDALQEMLEAELETELGYSKGDKRNKQTDNRRNGYTEKTVKTQFGEMPIEIPRDRNSEFEPIVVPKNKRDISGIEEK